MYCFIIFKFNLQLRVRNCTHVSEVRYDAGTSCSGLRPSVCVCLKMGYTVYILNRTFKEGRCSLATRSRGRFSYKQTHQSRPSLLWLGWLWKHWGRACNHLQKHTLCMEESSAYTVHVDGTFASTYFNYSYQRDWMPVSKTMHSRPPRLQEQPLLIQLACMSCTPWIWMQSCHSCRFVHVYVSSRRCFMLQSDISLNTRRV